MDVHSFKQQYDRVLGSLEEFQLELQETILMALSPTHETGSGLPSFTRRIRYKLHSFRDESRRSSSHRDDTSYRVGMWKNVLSELLAKLTALRQQVEVIPVDQEQHNGSVELPPFPALNALETALQQFEPQSKIVASRLASALGVFRALHQMGRKQWQEQIALQEATVNVHQVLAETLLTRFYTEIDNIAVVLRDFYERLTEMHLRRFEEQVSKQRADALQQQESLYRLVYQKIRQQHETFDRMMQLLGQQIQQSVAHHATRMRLDERLRKLLKRNQSVFIEAEIFYQSSHDTFVFQPLSPAFYRTLRQWLVDFQQLFADTLQAASPPSSPQTHRDSAQESILRQFISRTVFPKGAETQDASAAALMQPSPEAVNHLFSSFLQFHLETNQSAMERLQRQRQQLETSWHTLSQEVARAHKMQQKWYGGQSQAGQTQSSMSSPDVIRLLLQLDTQLKQLESRLETTYKSLFTQVQPEQVALQLQTEQIRQIIEQLSAWQQLNRDWEALIRQEQTFLKACHDRSLAASRYIASQFIQWNYTTTSQLDQLQTSIGLYATNIFHRYRVLFGDFVSRLIDVQHRSSEEQQLQMKMVSRLQEDARKEDGGAADIIARLQTQVEAWLSTCCRLQTSHQQSRFKHALEYHIAGIEAVLTRLSPEHFHNHSVQRFLETLDKMYETSFRCEENSEEQRNFVNKEQFLVDKLQLDLESCQ